MEQLLTALARAGKYTKFREQSVLRLRCIVQANRRVHSQNRG